MTEDCTSGVTGLYMPMFIVTEDYKRGNWFTYGSALTISNLSK